MTAPAIVFLLWDVSQEDKGQPPELFDVYATIEAAEAAAKRNADIEDVDDLDIGDFFDIEMREVKK